MNNTPTDETFTDKVIDIFHAELISINKKLREARRLAEKYRNLSCQDQDQADATLLPWETNQPTNRTMNMEHLLSATNKVVELNNQLAAVTEQRDRLAEALRNLGNRILSVHPNRDISKELNEAAEVLQSLTQPAAKGGSHES